MPYSILGAIDQMEMLNGVTCDNPCVILTLDNILMFCGNAEIPAGFDVSQPFAEIPMEFEPELGVIGTRHVPVVIGDSVGILRIEDNLLYANMPGVVHLDSVCVSYSGDWYTEELGNNKAQGTSELTEV